MFLDLLIRNLHQSLFRYSEVLKYLKSREVTEDDINKYGIGFNKIIKIIKSDDPEQQSFLDETYKGRKLENKLIFPIKSVMNQVVGLIGRSIETKEFKIFVTERAKFEGFFFGLYEALPYIYKENRVYLVEGPFDQLALSKVLPNTVATLTSKMSDAQFNVLSFYCDNIITFFDSDKAGDKGREKAEQKNNELGTFSSHIYSIKSDYKDPAKYLEDFKFDKFKKYILNKVKQAYIP